MNAIPSPNTIRQRIAASKAATRLSEIARASRVGRDHGVVDNIDYGPGHQVERGDLVREDRADPDDDSRYKRQIRGGRRLDGLRLMWARGQLSGAHWTATEKFRDDIALAMGARLSTPGQSGVRVAFRSENYHPSMMQIDAHTRCQAAFRRCSARSKPIVEWVVVQGKTLGAYEVAKRIRKDQTAKNWLVEGLDALADYYTGEKTS